MSGAVDGLAAAGGVDEGGGSLGVDLGGADPELEPEVDPPDGGRVESGAG